MIITSKTLHFKLRPCKGEDYYFVYNLLKRNMCSQFVKHWGKWDPKIFRKNFNKKNIKIITYKTKKVAFYDIEFKEGFSYINNLQLSTQVQKKGLGSVLIDIIEMETKNHSFESF